MTKWVEQTQLVMEGTNPGDEFGSEVAIDGDVIAVGAPGSSLTGPSGAVYIYELSMGSWELLQKIDADSTQNAFGKSIALRAGWLVVGAPGNTAEAIGKAWVFRRGPEQWDRLMLLDYSTAGDRFGGTVEVGQDGTVFVAAPWSDEANVDAGAVFIFAPGSSTPTKILPPPPVRPDAEGIVSPGKGGMLVSPDDPHNLPFFLLPLSLGGKGALPLFPLMVSSLAPRLSYRPDPKRVAKHGFVEPAAPVALAQYRAALAATEPDWGREA